MKMEVSGRRRVEGNKKQTNKGNTRECEACKGVGFTTKADGVCVKCNEFMCKKCFKDHLKAKQCRNHVFDTTFPKNVPLKRDFEVEKCKRHVGEQIKFFCRKHEIIGCGECMIPDHAVCSPENIKDLCKEFRFSLEFASLKRSIKDVECSAEANSMKIKENKKANTKMYKKALDDIKQFRKDINKFLDNAQKTILQEAQEVSDANDQRLTKLEKDYMLQSSRIAEVSGQLDPDLYSESGLFIQSVTLKSSVLNIQQFVSGLQQENNIKEFNFVPDKQLQRLTRSLHNFGRISCSSPPSTVSKEKTMELAEESPLTHPQKMLMPPTFADERRDKGYGSDKKIIVDSRVRARDGTLYRHPLFGIHRSAPGTVRNIGKGDTVKVQWDATGTQIYVNMRDIELL